MLSDSKVRDAVIEYFELLPAELKNRYGGTGLRGYTRGQITTAIDAAKLSSAHSRYAIALFGDEEAHNSMNINTTEFNELTDQLHDAIAGRKVPVLDRVVAKIIKFLEKAGDISDGAGNSYI